MNAFDGVRRALGLRPRPQPLACNQLVELITDYLEGTLPPAERARLDAHLEGCEGCRNYLEQMRLTMAATGALREESIPPETMDQLLQAFRAWNQS